MLVIGFVVKDPNSSQRKEYGAFADPNGRVITRYGGERAAFRTRLREREETPHRAAMVVADLFREKQEKGYSTTVADFGIAEVDDDTADAGLLDSFTTANSEGTTITFAYPNQATDQFAQMVASTQGQPAAAAPGPRKVASRDAALTLDPNETVIRPNGETYLPRDLGGHTDVAAVRALATSSLYCLLRGEPGTGKTALAEAAFPDLVAVQCHGDMTVAHLVGSHMPTPDGGWRWQDGPLTIAMQEGLVLYLDEINKLPSEVSTVLHAAIDGRRMIRIDDRPDADPVYAVDGFYVLGAYNPETLASGGLSEALLSRFTVQVEVTTDHDAARGLGVPETFITIAENLTSKGAEARSQGGRPVWAPQMRELLAAKQIIDAGLGQAFAAGAMVAQCPWPEDLATVVDVAAAVLGVPVTPLQLGVQV